MSDPSKTLVKCSVSNCHYWGERNICLADQIMIEIDSHSTVNLNEEFGDEYTGDHKDTAASSSATCCLTFKPK